MAKNKMKANYKYLIINGKKYATYLIEDRMLYLNTEKWHEWPENFIVHLIIMVEGNQIIKGVAFLNI